MMKLNQKQDNWTLRSLSQETGIARASIHRSLKRLETAGLFRAQNRHINTARVESFLLHSTQFLFPPKFEGITRGTPTAWGAQSLADLLAPEEELPPVWPDPHGTTRGIALQPIYKQIVEVSKNDPDLADQIKLVDALRAGSPRVNELAAKLLHENLYPRKNNELSAT